MPKQQQTQSRVLLLYLKTGGGHKSIAASIASEIEAKSGGKVSAEIFDGIPPSNLLLKRFVEKGYQLISTKYPILWRLTFEVSKLRTISALQTISMAIPTWRYIAKAIKDKKIDKVVNCHFLLTKPLNYGRRLMGLRTPTLTVICDPFTVHQAWHFDLRGPRIVFSELARRDSIEKWKVSEKQLILAPFVADPKFSSPLSKEKIVEQKKQHGFDPAKKLVLFAGGGDGFPSGERYLRALIASDCDFEIAIVCGRDRELKARAESIAGLRPDKKTVIYGFVDFMFELLNMADIVIAKGGPSSVYESLLLEKPLIVAQYYYGQERGNVLFALQNRVAYYLPDPKAMRARIEELVSRPELINEMKQRIRSLHLKNGADFIADYVINKL